METSESLDVVLSVRLTKAQREKLALLGGAEFLRQCIAAAPAEEPPKPRPEPGFALGEVWGRPPTGDEYVGEPVVDAGTGVPGGGCV